MHVDCYDLTIGYLLKEVGTSRCNMASHLSYRLCSTSHQIQIQWDLYLQETQLVLAHRRVRCLHHLLILALVDLIRDMFHRG